MKSHTNPGGQSFRSRAVVVLVLAGAESCRSAPAPLSASGPAPQETSLGPSMPSSSIGIDADPALLLAAPRVEQPVYEWPRLSVALGAQLVGGVNTSMRVDSETLGQGTEIDLENDFDVDKTLFLGRIDANWRIAQKHHLDFSIFELSRGGTRLTNRDIQIGDTTFPVNTSVTNEFDTLVVKLAYRYAFLDRPRWHMGASLGTHTMDWEAEWKANNQALKEDFGVLVPLPVLGLFGSYAFTPKLYLNWSTEFFGLEYDEFDGFLNNTRLNLEHRTFEHVAFGLGLDYFVVNASMESESGNLTAELDSDYLGLLIFIRIL